MSMKDIDGALIQGYMDLELNLPTAYENDSFTPPDDGSDWAAASIVPSVIDFHSLGDGGTDLHRGFMQLDFYTKNGSGAANLLDYADAVLAGLWGGKGLSKNGQNVLIDTVDRTPIDQVDGWTHIAMTVNWQAEMQRPTV